MMKFILIPVLLVLMSCDLFAWGNDSAGPPIYKYSISLHAGIPNTIPGAEVGIFDRYFYSPTGEFRSFSYSAGSTFRWYLDQSFFLHGRAAYSAQSEFLSDSVIADPQYFSDGFVNGQTFRTTEIEYYYKSGNVLVGIGGGHEIQVRKFVVRAGGEIDFVKYINQRYHFEERSKQHTHYDTVSSGGTYDYYREASLVSAYQTPKFWGIGILGHASLEYKLNDRIGIGATLLTGFMYSAALKGKLTQDVIINEHQYDSNGMDQVSFSNPKYVHTSSQQQFRAVPLNAQINFAFYFGK